MTTRISLGGSAHRQAAIIALAAALAHPPAAAASQPILSRAAGRHPPIRNPVVLTATPRIGTAVVVAPPNAYYWSRSYWPGCITTSASPYWYVTTYGGPPLQERARRLDPAAPDPTPSTPATPPIPVDEGREALLAGEYERAIAIYQRRDREQREIEQGAAGAPLPDRTALLMLGLAFAADDRMHDAVEAWSNAEAEEPGITLRPLDGRSLLGSRMEARQLTLRAVRFAQATRSPAAWNAVAILMDAEGRGEPAERMRQKAAQLRAPAPVQPKPVNPPTRPAKFSMPATEAR